jgi:hypothetical protein
MAAGGALVDRVTQFWVRATGRRVDLAASPWLEGPIGKTDRIGTTVFDELIANRGERSDSPETVGLLRADDVSDSALKLDGTAPEVRSFYFETSRFDLDSWAQWAGMFRPFGWLLAVIFSRRLQQLNVPLSSLDTSRGMSSNVFAVVDRAGRHQFTAWVRQLRATGNVIYAGAYSTAIVPAGATVCVRVVFPLPNGNAIVLMRPVVNADGSLTLVSSGEGFGAPGFYFTVHGRDGRVTARYVKSLRESIRVFVADGEVRADHQLSLWGRTFLRLHYQCRKRPINTAHKL